MITVDGIWLGTTQLSTLDANGLLDGTCVWVATVKRMFRLDLNSALVTTGTGDTRVVVAAGVSGAQWLSVTQQNLYWQSKTTWSIDPSNASGVADNENDGLTDTTPLRTWSEWLRRTGPAMTVTAAVTVRVLSDVPAGEPTLDLSQFAAGGTSQGIGITFLGVTTVLYSGTLTDASAEPWTVADSGIPVSWTASGLVSSSGGTRFIQKTTGNVRASISADMGSKTARISPPTNASTTSLGTATVVAFAAGDAYEVVAVPKLPAMFGARSVLVSTCFVDFGAPSSTSIALFNVLLNPRLSGFRVTTTFIAAGMHIGCLSAGCLFQAATSLTGRITFRNCTFLNSLQLSCWTGDNNACTNEFRGSTSAIHSCVGNLGTMHVHDVVGTALRVGHSSNVEINQMRGAGNAGALVDVTEPGSLACAPGGAAEWQATTSAAHAYRACGTDYDAVDLPVILPTKAAGVAC